MSFSRYLSCGKDPYKGSFSKPLFLKLVLYIESVHNVDTLWTDYLKNRIFVAFRRENTRVVREVTDFVDRHYIKG